jgi:RsiW-degrading membrane proteinase PrsW (M82 family)
MSTVEEPHVRIPLHEPSAREMLFFFLSGAIVSVPFAIVFESLASYVPASIPSPYNDVLTIAIIAPLVEELGKGYPLFYRHGENKKSLMNMGFLVGLGFGLTELLEYVLILKVPIIFRVPGLFFHAFMTSIFAYGIANKKPGTFYALAVLLHFGYNMIAIFDTSGVLFLTVFVLAAYIFAYLYQRTPQEQIPY